jgi:hypothetical protein
MNVLSLEVRPQELKMTSFLMSKEEIVLIQSQNRSIGRIGDGNLGYSRS